MTAIRLIALNVFRESVRDKVLYNLAFFAILLMGASYLIGQLTAGQDVKIIKDLGLAATEIFGLFIAIFIGIGLVSKEVERRSIYALLAKPVSRPQLILGKYCGLVLTLAVNVARTARCGCAIRSSSLGPISSRRTTPATATTVPTTRRRQRDRAATRSSLLTEASTSGSPAGERRMNAPGRGSSPAPSYRMRSATGASGVASV